MSLCLLTLAGALALLSLLTAPAGVLLIWNRSTNLAEGLGHAVLLGLALHLLTALPLVVAIFLINLLICLSQFLWKSSSVTSNSHEGHLQVMTRGFFSLALLILFKLKCDQTAIEQMLWGDVLGISLQDLPRLALLVLASLWFLKINFKAFLCFLVDQELAQLEGLNLKRTHFALWLFFVTTITIGLRYFGALLLPSILMAPALLTQRHAKSPEGAILGSILISLVLIFLGLGLALAIEFEVSSSICIVSSLAPMVQFAFFSLKKKFDSKKN